MKNIILIGYRGVGKSTIAQKLAEHFLSPMLSLDECIKEQVGDLQQFIQREGWEIFRRIEGNALKSLPANHHIIDCGGGIIETAENISILRELGTVVWLKANEQTIQTRLKTTHTRLSLSGTDYVNEISQVLKRRNPLYQKAAHYIIDTDHKELREIVQQIIQTIEPNFC
ncbi:MAG: shikimate kinase [Spirochaetes bacterium]|nr:shikimate kinase [Spirochaetota bacterium]